MFRIAFVGVAGFRNDEAKGTTNYASYTWKFAWLT